MILRSVCVIFVYSQKKYNRYSQFGLTIIDCVRSILKLWCPIHGYCCNYRDDQLPLPACCSSPVIGHCSYKKKINKYSLSARTVETYLFCVVFVLIFNMVNTYIVNNKIVQLLLDEKEEENKLLSTII
jgi:hypothetical protein